MKILYDTYKDIGKFAKTALKDTIYGVSRLLWINYTIGRKHCEILLPTRLKDDCKEAVGDTGSIPRTTACDQRDKLYRDEGKVKHGGAEV